MLLMKCHIKQTNNWTSGKIMSKRADSLSRHAPLHKAIENLGGLYLEYRGASQTIDIPDVTSGYRKYYLNCNNRRQ